MRFSILAGAVLLAGCASTATTAPPATPAAVALPYTSSGLERVIGQDAAALVKLFGQPDADVREGDARNVHDDSRRCAEQACDKREGEGRQACPSGAGNNNNNNNNCCCCCWAGNRNRNYSKARFLRAPRRHGRYGSAM